MPLPCFRAVRILGANRRGSSSPVIVETDAGTFLAKLRGAAQGLLPLVAEIVVAELATGLALPVPERVLVELERETPTDDRNDELADLLARSSGTNLGFRWLEGAADLRADRTHLVDADVAARVVWLDAFVMNPDRTARNPNLMLWHGGLWLIDHGAALAFHYDLGGVTEDTPREPGRFVAEHLLRARAGDLGAVDAECARAVTRDVLRAALDAVPSEFLAAAFPGDDVSRSRAAYVAFLWKRLKAPRPFLSAG